MDMAWMILTTSVVSLAMIGVSAFMTEKRKDIWPRLSVADDEDGTDNVELEGGYLVDLGAVGTELRAGPDFDDDMCEGDEIFFFMQEEELQLLDYLHEKYPNGRSSSNVLYGRA